MGVTVSRGSSQQVGDVLKHKIDITPVTLDVRPVALGVKRRELTVAVTVDKSLSSYTVGQPSNHPHTGSTLKNKAIKEDTQSDITPLGSAGSLEPIGVHSDQSSHGSGAIIREECCLDEVDGVLHRSEIKQTGVTGSGSFCSADSSSFPEIQHVEVSSGCDMSNQLDEFDDDELTERTHNHPDPQVQNQRFNTSRLGHKPSMSRSQGPVLSTSITERPTRLNSANFNPHGVPSDVDDSELEGSDGASRSVDEAEEGSSMDRLSDLERSSTRSQLSVPSHSWTRNSHDTGRGSPVDDMDPFEGLDIPRRRLSSFGSASVYSVRELSDDLYQQYRSEVKNCIRGYGFFEAFPSPEVIAEAQRVYRDLDIPTPVDERGHILPHPPKMTVQSFLASESRTIEQAKIRIPELEPKMELSDVVDVLCEGLGEDTSRLVMVAAWTAYRPRTETEPRDSGADCKNFREMCNYARIKTKLVKGVVRDKTSRYKTGAEEEENREVWVAVLVGYTWLLADPSLANQHSTHTDATINAEDFDFLGGVRRIFCDPEHFIFSHFPDDEHWQLLARPVSREELPDLAHVSPLFFRLNLQLLNLSRACKVVQDSETEISLLLPENAVLQFNYSFEQSDKLVDASQLRECVFLESVFAENKVNLRMRFPQKGTYSLDLLLETNHSTKSMTADTMYLCTWILEYVSDETMVPFPLCPGRHWGPGALVQRLGLRPRFHTGGIIHMQRHVLQIVFENAGNHRFDQKLTLYDAREEIGTYQVKCLRDKNKAVVFVVDVEREIEGTFVLQLFVKENDKENFENFCNYMIVKQKSSAGRAFSFDNKQTNAKKVIKAPDSGTLQLAVAATGIIELDVELKLNGTQELTFTNHTRHWLEGDVGHIDLNFPRSGIYTVTVHGKTIHNGNFEQLREERIAVEVPSEKWSAFPREGVAWNSWYRLLSPLTEHLSEKDDVTWTVDVRDAQDVAMLGTGGWFHLDRQEPAWRWEGRVRTGTRGTRCQLLARFEVGNSKWTELLSFKVISADDFARLQDRQMTAIADAKNQRQSLQTPST